MRPLEQGYPAGSPALERTAEWYESSYQADHIAALLRPPDPRPELDELTYLPAVRLCRGAVLDLGCGTGRLAEFCASGRVPYYLGCDPSATAISLAKRRFDRVYQAVAPLFIVATALEALDSIADADEYRTVALLEVLEHVYGDREIIGAIPRGKNVVFSVPNFHCEGHCRWFGHAGQVIERYRDLLEIDEVIETAKGSHRWWIVRGVTR